jgi:polygalacturonase
VGQCREAVMRTNLVYEPNEIAERGHIPTVRNVYMENVTCKKSKYGILINGLDDSDNVYNINIKNCRFEGLTAEPLYKTGKCHDIKLENVTVSAEIK